MKMFCDTGKVGCGTSYCLLTFGVRQHRPPQRTPQQPFRSSVAVEPDIAKLSHVVHEELTALFFEQLFLLSTAPLVAQHSTTPITCHKMNISCIVDFAVRSSELLN